MKDCPTCGRSMPEGLTYVDLDTDTMAIDGKRLKLGPIEAAVMFCLVEVNGKRVSVDTFIRKVYGYNEPEYPSVAIWHALFSLRRKISTITSKEIIMNKYRDGYYLENIAFKRID